MFTGIVEEIGRVNRIKRGPRSAVLEISADRVLENTEIGASIAVNGICLTVTSLGNGCFTVDVMPETLSRSSLSQLSCGSSVNLERAMPAGGRFGGHIVSGHIDSTGKITGVRKDDNAVRFQIRTGPKTLRYIVEKGSITVDGISLTVADVQDDGFSVSIIPHTIGQTILAERKTGDLVNLETDLIGKYVEKFLSASAKPQADSAITRELLAQYGF